MTVPAGEFKAIEIELTGTRDTEITSRGAPSTIEHTIWYVPAIKRMVRQESGSSSPFAQVRGIGTFTSR